MTVVEIVEAAGVAKATVTNYFPHKEDLPLDRQAEAENCSPMLSGTVRLVSQSSRRSGG